MQRLRPYFDRHSIRFRLFRLVVVVATTVLVFSMAGGALFEWNNQQQRLEQSLSTMAQATGAAASAAVAFHDSRAANEALRILIERKEIEAVALYPVREDLFREYPELEADDVRQSLDFAACNLDDEVISLEAA